MRTSVATGDNGLVAVRSSGTWKTYTAGSSSYRFANLVGPPDGSSVELLDSAWQYTLHTYADSPTVIATITPVQLVSSINSAPFVFNPQNGSMNIGVSLSAIDGNHAAPSVILHTLRGGTRSLTNDGLYDLPRGNSDISCSIGTIAPKDSTYSLVVRADSLLLRKNCLIGTINASCGTCYFAPYTFQSRQSWVQGDTVVFIASTDTLRITHGGGATVTVQQNISNTVSEFICSMYGNAIIVSFPRRSSNSVNNVSLFDARGRRLANVPVSNDMTSVRISTPLQSAIVYACISLSDGSVIRKILPLLR